MNRQDYRELVWIAQAYLNNARRLGICIPQPCAVCHFDPTEGHHTDYRKPEEVVWLCRKHHRRAHKGVLQFLGADTIFRTVDYNGNPLPKRKYIGSLRSVNHGTDTRVHSDCQGTCS